MSAIVKGVSTKMKVVGLKHLCDGKQVDTLAVLKSLEAQGVPSKAIISALTKLLNDHRLENASDMPKNVKLQGAPLPPSLERLSLSIDNMNSQLIANLDKINSDFNRKVRQDVKEMLASLEAGQCEFEAQLKATKYDVLMIPLAALVSSAFGFAFVTLRKS